MSLDRKFAPVRDAFYDLVSNFFIKIASLFGYPENIGLPTIPDKPELSEEILDYISRLPKHRTQFPPREKPETPFEVFFGTMPHVETVERHYYQSAEEGFFNFYIDNFKNLYFLPDGFSEFLQIQFNFCLDIELLEGIREAVFVLLFFFYQAVSARLMLSWFVYINPYTFPWFYLVAIVDWIDETFQGLLPSIFGVNVTGTILLGIIGSCADSLNHMIFTMPYLPSEAVSTQLTYNIDERTLGKKEVLIFHYLPILWYRHPIPNDVREFWYYERPDILEYLQKAYARFDIQFLPDQIVEELSQKTLSPELSLISQSFFISGNDININNLFQTDFIFQTINFTTHNFLL